MLTAGMMLASDSECMTVWLGAVSVCVGSTGWTRAATEHSFSTPVLCQQIQIQLHTFNGLLAPRANQLVTCSVNTNIQ